MGAPVADVPEGRGETVEFEQSKYLFPNAAEQGRGRLQSLERTYDPATIRRFDEIGVALGWRCLEVGTGAGSIARHLADRVGPTGSVVAVDLDTSLAGEGRGNLEFRVIDLREQAPPARSFDLVHARLVLGHIAERAAVLTSLIGGLAPDGWLVIEEADDVVSQAIADPDYGRVMNTVFDVVHSRVPRSWARELPDALHHHGLIEVCAGYESPMVEGGSPEAEMLERSAVELHASGALSGITVSGMAQWRQLVNTPGRWFPGISVMSARGRRPPSGADGGGPVEAERPSATRLH